MFSALVLLVTGAAWRTLDTLTSNLATTAAIAGGDAKDGATDILLVGMDSRTDAQGKPLSAQERQMLRAGDVASTNTDTIILLRIPNNGSSATGISIPRDSYVVVPAGGPWDGGRNKINSAFAYGGAKLTVRTTEGFTGVRLDHIVLINFAGFQKMTDALGGVDVRVDRTVYDPRSLRTFRAGVNYLNGAAALDYVRQRYNLPRGDFDREQRQQQFLRVLLQKATDTGTLANPKKLTGFLDAASRSIIVDNDLSVSKTAVAFRRLRADKLTFVTTPNVGSQNVPGAGSVVRIDHDKALALFEAVRNDTMVDWLRANPANDVTSGA